MMMSVFSRPNRDNENRVLMKKRKTLLTTIEIETKTISKMSVF